MVLAQVRQGRGPGHGCRGPWLRGDAGRVQAAKQRVAGSRVERLPRTPVTTGEECEGPRRRGSGRATRLTVLGAGGRRRRSAQKPLTPSPPPACSSKFSCSSRCSTGTPSLRRAREVQSTWKNSATTCDRVKMIASAASTSATLAASASTGSAATTSPVTSAPTSGQPLDSRRCTRSRASSSSSRWTASTFSRSMTSAGRGEHLARGDRPQGRLDPGGGVLDRQQDVVAHRVGDVGVQAAHLLRRPGATAAARRAAPRRTSSQSCTEPSPPGRERQRGRRTPARRAARSRRTPGPGRDATA